MNAQMRQAIFEAIGEASMCWSNIDKAGVFESTRAQDIGERLVKTLAVPKEIKFEWRKDGDDWLCFVNDIQIGYTGPEIDYLQTPCAKTGHYEAYLFSPCIGALMTEPEARLAVEDAFRVWLGGVYGG